MQELQLLPTQEAKMEQSSSGFSRTVRVNSVTDVHSEHDEIWSCLLANTKPGTLLPKKREWNRKATVPKSNSTTAFITLAVADFQKASLKIYLYIKRLFKNPWSQTGENHSMKSNLIFIPHTAENSLEPNNKSRLILLLFLCPNIKGCLFLLSTYVHLLKLRNFISNFPVRPFKL